MAPIRQIIIGNLVLLHPIIVYCSPASILKTIRQEGMPRLYRTIIILIQWAADEELIIILI
jgi:hypothetical protein